MTLRPGQLWRWKFDVNGGWWLLTKVTEAARHGTLLPEIVVIRLNDTFMVIKPDDPGPWTNRVITSDKHYRRWHVVMLGDQLVWLDHVWLDNCELACDAK